LLLVLPVPPMSDHRALLNPPNPSANLALLPRRQEPEIAPARRGIARRPRPEWQEIGRVDYASAAAAAGQGRVARAHQPDLLLLGGPSTPEAVREMLLDGLDRIDEVCREAAAAA
jgi:hypothetical protein